MMHEDVDDEEEEIVLDRRTLIRHGDNSSDPALLGVNRFNIKVYDESMKVSRTKSILLAATCTSIGMIIGLLGPTFSFLAESMQVDTAAIVRLIVMKSIGYLLGTMISTYLYLWFNVCCLLGLSCLAISFAICSFPFLTDLTTFYITSLIFGFGLSISHNGIESFYNRLWSRSPLNSIRWLHLLVAFGAIISLLMLFPSASSHSEIDLLTTPTPTPARPRRQAPLQDISSLLASLTIDNSSNITSTTVKTLEQTNETLSSTSTSTPGKIMKPSLVETDKLKQSIVTKPGTETKTDIPAPCLKSYCCYDRNITIRNETNATTTFECQDQMNNPSDICNNVLNTCKTATLQVCSLNMTNIWCRIDQVCGNNRKPECTILEIELSINASKTTTTSTTTTTTTESTTPLSTTLSTITSTTTTSTTPSTTPSTASTTTTTTTTTTTATTTTTTTSTTTTTVTTHSTTRRSKPAMAESDNDEISQNLFYKKIRTFFHLITSIHLIYLFLALIFFVQSVLYSLLAMRGEGAPTSTKPVNMNPITLLFSSTRRPTSTSNSHLSLLSDRASWKFVSFLVFFYFILAGIEYCCTYLTYSFGMKLKYSERSSLMLQFLFFLGLFLDRVMDMCIEYGCLLFNTRVTNRTKKQSEKFQLVSIKFYILIRLVFLLIFCSILTFSHLFQDIKPTNSSVPSSQMFNFLFFLIGFLIGSLPTLLLFWIERDLSLNDSLIRIILIVMTFGEMIFPSSLFYIIQHFVLSYLFYLFLGSCCLCCLFICILYSGKRWQRKKLYRILPTSMEIEEIEIENQSDHEYNDYPIRNGYDNANGSKMSTDNDRTKSTKEH